MLIFLFILLIGAPFWMILFFLIDILIYAATRKD